MAVPGRNRSQLSHSQFKQNLSKEQVLQQLQRAVPQASVQGLDMIASMIQWDPMQRPSPQEVLQHEFITQQRQVLRQNNYNQQSQVSIPSQTPLLAMNQQSHSQMNHLQNPPKLNT
jgi:serine/threonine protein kinase